MEYYARQMDISSGPICPEGDNTAMDRPRGDQFRTLRWLQELSDGLAELYEGALRMVADRSFPGRLRFVCHAVREIRNRLPEAVAGKNAIRQLEYPERVEKLAQACERAGLVGVRVEDEQVAEGKIPQEVIALLGNLVSEHRKVAGRKRENAKRLLIALEPENKNFQASLVPVVDAWLKETEWFEKHVHIGKASSKDDLVTHFAVFERLLASLVGYFYEGMEDIERIIKHANTSKQVPDENEVKKVVILLGRARCRIHFFDKLENPYWVNPLKDVGFFKSPPDPKEGESYENWPQGWYLKKMSSKVPEEVLDVIKGIESGNPFIRGASLDCLLEMREGVAAEGVGVVKTLLGERQYSGDWGLFLGGKQAAELMIKLIDKHPKEAFEIARLLLDVWRPGEKEAGVFETIRSKFAAHDYKELIFDYYNKVWEKRPFEATRALVDIYDKYLEECFKQKGYDVSEYLGVSIHDLEDIQRLEYDLDSIIMKAICEAGRAAIEKDPEKVGDLLEDLEKRDKGIFHRVEMYLLRFVLAGIEKDRINGLVGDKKFIEDPLYRYEHRHLLNDKFDQVSEETRKRFVEWVEENKITEERKKEVEEWCQKNNKPLPDFEKWENQRKAEELYLVRERFKELYEQYKKGAGVQDDVALAPRQMVGEACFVDREEGAELNKEEMLKMNPAEVIKLVSTKKDWGKAEKGRGFFSGEVAQAEVFGQVVKERVDSYLAIEPEEIAVIPTAFLEKFLNAIWMAARERKINTESWGWILSLCYRLVEENKEKKESRGVFLELLNVVGEAFDKEDIVKEVVSENIKKIWEIISPLVMFNEEENQREWEYLRDSKGRKQEIVTASLNMVVGKALTMVLRLGLISKNKNKEYFDNTFWTQLKDVLEHVLTNIKRPTVWCVFGLWLPQLCYLNQQWVKESLNRIFSHEEENDELWEAVFGTHVVRGRPSRQAFNVLKEGGEYEYASENLSREDVFGGQKSWKKGLTEHLMIAYFNGWIDFEDDVLNVFFEKSPPELRGEAARFLTTGFKSVNEEGGPEKETVTARMREYWKKRLGAIKDNPQENIEEAVELSGWVQDSVLEAKETLELLEETLQVSRGKIGKMRDARDFVQGVCELGRGNELLVLRCLKKAAADENMRAPWAAPAEELVEFLDLIASLETGHDNLALILGEAIEVADSYGRFQPDKFRGVWESLRRRREMK